MRRLLVMRHAKSDWDAGGPDRLRPLNARGRRSADAMGRLLADIGEVPDVALTSPATRARTTVERAAAAGGWDTRIAVEDRLYATTVAEALAVVAAAPDVDRLMLVGHEPTWSSLVGTLTGGSVAVRTATVVGIDLAADWADIEPGAGQIAYVLPARAFAG